MTGNAYLDDDGKWVQVEQHDTDLVDDPHQPGRTVRRSLAQVHPTQRFAKTIDRHFAKKAAK